LIGGSLFAVAFGILGVQLCGYDEGDCHNPALKAAAGAVIGFVLGFGPGALLGGQFPKHSSASLVSTPKDR
jgi:hypothetical protein